MTDEKLQQATDLKNEITFAINNYEAIKEQWAYYSNIAGVQIMLKWPVRNNERKDLYFDSNLFNVDAFFTQYLKAYDAKIEKMKADYAAM